MKDLFIKIEELKNKIIKETGKNVIACEMSVKNKKGLIALIGRGRNFDLYKIYKMEIISGKYIGNDDIFFIGKDFVKWFKI